MTVWQLTQHPVLHALWWLTAGCWSVETHTLLGNCRHRHRHSEKEWEETKDTVRTSSQSGWARLYFLMQCRTVTSRRRHWETAEPQHTHSTDAVFNHSVLLRRQVRTTTWTPSPAPSVLRTRLLLFHLLSLHSSQSSSSSSPRLRRHALTTLLCLFLSLCLNITSYLAGVASRHSNRTLQSPWGLWDIVSCWNETMCICMRCVYVLCLWTLCVCVNLFLDVMKPGSTYTHTHLTSHNQNPRPPNTTYYICDHKHKHTHSRAVFRDCCY